MANAQKHVKRKSKSSRGLYMHIVKLRHRGWESRFQNKILLPWAKKDWRSLCVSPPQSTPVSFSTVSPQLSGYHNHPHRTQLQPSTASHVSLTHPCVHITPHASPGATHHTPHSASLHPPSASWPGRERTTTGTARIKIRTRSEQETNMKGLTTQSGMRFPWRTGCDSRNMTDATLFPELTLC